MKSETICQIEFSDDESIKTQSYLYFLYYPLIGKEACIVYEILHGLQEKKLPLSQVETMCMMSSNSFVYARKQLEQYHLLKTYFDKEENRYIFRIFSPLSANRFFSHDTYGRMFLQKMGSKHFDEVKLFFHQEMIDVTSMDEITEPMDVSSLDQWSDADESLFSEVKTEPEDQFRSYEFDFDEFLKGMDNIFPIQYRTKEQLSRIASLATIHGITEKKMRTYVMRSINPHTKFFDFDKLHSLVLHSQTQTKNVKDVYSLSPVQYLTMRQKGAPVPVSERKLIERICSEYHFSNEVMNVLIDYVLKQTNQQFPKAYVEKVAASWSRLNVDTKEKALAQTKRSVSKTKQDLPEWYTNTSDEKASDDLMEQALAAQHALKGEDA